MQIDVRRQLERIRVGVDLLRIERCELTIGTKILREEPLRLGGIVTADRLLPTWRARWLGDMGHAKRPHCDPFAPHLASRGRLQRAWSKLTSSRDACQEPARRFSSARATRSCSRPMCKGQETCKGKLRCQRLARSQEQWRSDELDFPHSWLAKRASIPDFPDSKARQMGSSKRRSDEPLDRRSAGCSRDRCGVHVRRASKGIARMQVGKRPISFAAWQWPRSRASACTRQRSSPSVATLRAFSKDSRALSAMRSNSPKQAQT